MLSVRTLVLSPQEDLGSWLRLANICRKNG
jgi:hypothetical protein